MRKISTYLSVFMSLGIRALFARTPYHYYRLDVI